MVLSLLVEVPSVSDHHFEIVIVVDGDTDVVVVLNELV